MKIINNINEALEVLTSFSTDLFHYTIVYENNYVIEFDTYNTPQLYDKNRYIGVHQNTLMELQTINGILIKEKIHQFQQLEKVTY